MSETLARGSSLPQAFMPLHWRRDGIRRGGQYPARRHSRDGKKFPGLAVTLEEETTVATDGELYEIDFLRPIEPCSPFQGLRGLVSIYPAGRGIRVAKRQSWGNDPQRERHKLA